MAVLLGVGAVGTGQWWLAAVCGVFAVLGMCAVSDEHAYYRGRVNRDRWWAYGEEPGWARKRR